MAGMHGDQYGQEMENENSDENCDEILEGEDGEHMMGEMDDRERSPHANMDA